MPNCPICGYKYNSEQDSNCSKCDWSISDDPTVFPLPAKVINWAKESWYKYELEQQKQINRQLQEELDKFRQESNEKFNIIQQSLEKLSQQIININQKSETSDREKYYLIDNNTVSNDRYIERVDRELNNYNYSFNNHLQIAEINSEDKIFPESDRVDRNESNIEVVLVEKSYEQQLEQYVIENYNKNPASFSINTIEVSTTNESIEGARNGNTNNIIFAITPRGNYWIYSWEGFHYLIPKDKPKINPFQLDIVKIIFDCENYQDDYSRLELIKPVKVSPLSGEQWQLDKRGIIRFL